MRIEVTQEDIDKGAKGDCLLCPIAHAVMRATGAQCVNVHTRIEVLHTDKTGWRHFGHTPASFEFLRAFDREEPVSPFSFELVPL